MALAIDVTDGRGLSNEVCGWLLSKKSKVFAIHFTVKALNQLYITNNMERFSFKSGCAVHIEKLTKTDWLVVLQ